jgi:2-oxoglutarate ferredoxin oxidoreductase subunit delta
MTEKVKDVPRRAWTYPPRSEHPDADVFVYDAWCKGCGICYELCPTGVLSADRGGRPIVEKPEACIACYLCEMLCPDMAITVYKERKKPAAGEKVGEPSRNEGGDDD